MKAWRFPIMLLAMLLALPAQAAVTITFYSHAFGSSFPHAFVTLKGTPDAGGTPVDADYGFTAVNVTPAVLMGSVRGAVESAGPAYVRNSHAHFSLVLSDAEYARVVAVVEHWRNAPQNSYNLDTANCIHFVAEIARTLGLKAEVTRAVRRRPTSFLDQVEADNRTVLAVRRTHSTIAAAR